VGCCCFGEGVGPVDERLDAAAVPQGENGLEFFAEDGDLPPQVADVDAADGPVVVHQPERCQQRYACHLGDQACRAAPLPAGQVGEPIGHQPAARAE